MDTAKSSLYNFICTIATMSRRQIEREINRFDGRFKLDFSTDYLKTQSLDKLRHILLAAAVQQKFGNH